MAHEMTSDPQPELSAAPAEPPLLEESSAQKKPFVPPTVTRHGTLPEVTTGFFGTFSP